MPTIPTTMRAVVLDAPDHPTHSASARSRCRRHRPARC